MPSLQSRFYRLIIKYYVAARFERAGDSISDWRKLLDSFAEMQRIPASTEIEPALVDGIPAEWVRAPSVQNDRAMLYLHGGAFVMGSPVTHRELAARLSAAADARALILDYRLAPEHPFPAAIQDAVAAYHWLLDRGYTANCIAIGGDSAGGGLTLQTLLTLRDEGAPLPAAAFFLSPVTDWVRFDGESYTTRDSIDPWITLEMCKFTAAHYVGDNDPETPLLSPVNVDLAGLPPLCIHVGDDEILLSDSVRLAERARAANVEVEFKDWEGMWHVFQSSAALVPEARRSIAAIGRFVVDHFA